MHAWGRDLLLLFVTNFLASFLSPPPPNFINRCKGQIGYMDGGWYITLGLRSSNIGSKLVGVGIPLVPGSNILVGVGRHVKGNWTWKA